MSPTSARIPALVLVAWVALAPVDAGALEPAPASTVWVSFHAGATFATGATLSTAGTATTLDSAGVPDAVMGLGVHYRTSRFDLGLLMSGVGGGAFRGDGDGRERRLGGMARVAALLRWRYLNDDWGALTLRVSPGVAFVSHSDSLRAEVAAAIGRRRTELDGVVDSHNTAFSIGIGFGLMLNLTRAILAYLEFETLTTATTLQEGASEVGYSTVQPSVMLGMEARL